MYVHEQKNDFDEKEKKSRILYVINLVLYYGPFKDKVEERYSRWDLSSFSSTFECRVDVGKPTFILWCTQSKLYIPLSHHYSFIPTKIPPPPPSSYI